MPKSHLLDASTHTLLSCFSIAAQKEPQRRFKRGARYRGEDFQCILGASQSQKNTPRNVPVNAASVSHSPYIFTTYVLYTSFDCWEEEHSQAGGLTPCPLFIRHDDSFMLHVRVVPVRFCIVPRPSATALPSAHGKASEARKVDEYTVRETWGPVGLGCNAHRD